ncbi:MAG: pyridoxal phosphate-dependent aminotransferase [Bryobacteraceae bacterium]
MYSRSEKIAFSSRLHWDLQPNRLSAAVERKRLRGEPLLDLTESNPTRAGFRYPEGEILQALADPRALGYRPAPLGAEEARVAVAEYYGVRVETSRIVLTTGTSESYGLLFKALADPGDEVLVPRPSYPLFDFLASLESVRAVQYPLHYHGGWYIDCDALEAAVTPRTRAIVLVNPNNPTGSFLKRGELERLGSICRRHGLVLISDEVFADYAFEEDAPRVASLVDAGEVPAFSLSGLSKVSGLPQMKLGWIVVSGPAEFQAAALARLELIADTYLSVGTPVQLAAEALLGVRTEFQRQLVDRLSGNLAFLRERAARSPSMRVLDVEGGWYATLRVPGIRSEEEWVLELLEQDGVLVQPGFFFDFESEAFLVMSLMTPEEEFRAGIERIFSRDV